MLEHKAEGNRTSDIIEQAPFISACCMFLFIALLPCENDGGSKIIIAQQYNKANMNYSQSVASLGTV